MKASALGSSYELPVRELGVDVAPQLSDAVDALLYGLTLAAPVAPRVALRTVAEPTASGSGDELALHAAPQAHVSARALAGAPANRGGDKPSEPGGLSPAGLSPADVEALVRAAASRSVFAPIVPAPSAAVAESSMRAAPAHEPPPTPTRQLTAALVSAHTSSVEFGAGGADAVIEVAHPELGPIRLELSFNGGAVSLRALTPSSATAALLRALEPSVAKALATRGVALRALRVDVASDSRTSLSRAPRRRPDFEEEA
jgi:hypothetical protein